MRDEKIAQENTHRNARACRAKAETCFNTFLQVPPTAARTWAESLSVDYHEHRQQVMLTRQFGLSNTCNLFPTLQRTGELGTEEFDQRLDHGIIRGALSQLVVQTLQDEGRLAAVNIAT